MNAPVVDAKPAGAAMAKALRLAAKAEAIEQLAPAVESRRIERLSASDVLVEVRAAAINPSDAKAAIGMMPYAVFPRTPGRDFAGTVIDGRPNGSAVRYSAPPAISVSAATARTRRISSSRPRRSSRSRPAFLSTRRQASACRS